MRFIFFFRIFCYDFLWKVLKNGFLVHLMVSNSFFAYRNNKKRTLLEENCIKLFIFGSDYLDNALRWKNNENVPFSLFIHSAICDVTQMVNILL